MSVHHNKWTKFVHKNETFRVRLVDRSSSHSRFEIQRNVGTRPLLWIFGEEVPVWKNIIPGHRVNYHSESFIRRESYPSDWVKEKSIEAIEKYSSVNTPHEDTI